MPGTFDPSTPVESAWSAPSHWYTDPGFAALERRHLFPRTWQLAGRAQQLAQPGDFVSGCLAGEPFAVTRDTTGALRSFDNVCRHRAAPVALGDGNAAHLTCAYHGWTYHLDGRLRTAPHLAGVRDFDRATMTLPPRDVETWGPLVMTRQRQGGPTLAASAAPLTAALERSGWTRLRYHASKTWDIACNWKVFCDNYLDGGYHIENLHPTLDAQLDMGSYATVLHDRCSVQTSGATQQTDVGLDVDPGRRIGEGAWYGFLYPNLMINRYGPALDINYVRPLGVDRCEVVFDFFFDEGVDDDFMRRSREAADATQREDVWICEQVQRGLSSGRYQRGRYAPRLEHAVHQFHRLLATDLSADGGDLAGHR